MADIVDFPEKEQKVWQCACGCWSFFLYEGGATECADCASKGDTHGGWRARGDCSFDIHDYDKQPETNKVRIDRETDPSLPNLTRRSFARAAEKDDNLYAIILINKNGETRVWNEERAETRKQRGWVNERLAQIARGLKVPISVKK